MLFVLVVLSSDEEEGVKSCDVPQGCSQMVHTQVSKGDAEMSPEAKQQEEATDSEDTEVGMRSFLEKIK